MYLYVQMTWMKMAFLKRNLLNPWGITPLNIRDLGGELCQPQTPILWDFCDFDQPSLRKAWNTSKNLRNHIKWSKLSAWRFNFKEKKIEFINIIDIWLAEVQAKIYEMQHRFHLPW